jgi:hypothetical protein
MTASANSFIEAPTGFGLIKAAQGIYEESATAKAKLGTRVQVGDRVFYYAYAGGVALVAGKIVSQAAVAAETNKTVEAAAAAGTYSVTVTTVAAQLYLAEGYLCVNDAAGEGLMYKIKNSAANATTATSTDITLYDPIVTALTTSSEVTMLLNPYYDLDLSATITDHIIGIPPIPVTANYYFWCQTWGPCPGLGTASTAVGSLVVPHTTDGALVIQTAYTSNIVGSQMVVAVSGEYRPVFLRITP